MTILLIAATFNIARAGFGLASKKNKDAAVGHV